MQPLFHVFSAHLRLYCLPSRCLLRADPGSLDIPNSLWIPHICSTACFPSRQHVSMVREC
jgi:hypothetical protein